jgi:hypothetical protein
MPSYNDRVMPRCAGKCSIIHITDIILCFTCNCSCVVYFMFFIVLASSRQKSMESYEPIFHCVETVEYVA